MCKIDDGRSMQSLVAISFFLSLAMRREVERARTPIGARVNRLVVEEVALALTCRSADNQALLTDKCIAWSPLNKLNTSR